MYVCTLTYLWLQRLILRSWPCLLPCQSPDSLKCSLVGPITPALKLCTELASTTTSPRSFHFPITLRLRKYFLKSLVVHLCLTSICVLQFPFLASQTAYLCLPYQLPLNILYVVFMSYHQPPQKNTPTPASKFLFPKYFVFINTFGHFPTWQNDLKKKKHWARLL